MENSDFKNYIEKPTYHFDVSMGIYVFNKNVVNVIPKGEKMDMPELILKLKQLNKKLSATARIITGWILEELMIMKKR